MNVLIIAEYMSDLRDPEKANSRFLTVADALAERGHHIHIVTTDFLHGPKIHMEGVTQYKGHPLTALREPGYPKNVCLRRFYSHNVLSHHLKKWLNTADYEKPDVIYCAVPSLDFAYQAARYAKKKGIRFVLDIQDLWPEAFEMVLPAPGLTRIALTPLRMRANAIYRAADTVVAVSQTYVDRALRVNRASPRTEAVFLGTDLAGFDAHKEHPIDLVKGDGEIWLGYVGTLGHSYDLKTVFDALDGLREQPFYPRLRMIVAGDGPLRGEFEAYAAAKGLAVTFTGMLPYPAMVSLLCRCDVAINPIKKKSAGSIINKHGDYAAAGIPVINTQESPEYRRLVEAYGMGINCGCESVADVTEALIRLAGSEDLRRQMGEGSRRCAEELFDRATSYKRIVSAIEGH